MLRGRGWIEPAKETLLVFGGGILICIFYSLKSGVWEYRGEEWGTIVQFLGFWKGYAHFAVLYLFLFFIALRVRAPEAVTRTVLAAFLFFAMGIAIYLITRYRGFFFTPRQYLYYELFLPVSLLLGIWVAGKPGFWGTLESSWPAFVRVGKYAAPVGIILLLFIGGVPRQFSRSVADAVVVLKDGLAPSAENEVFY